MKKAKSPAAKKRLPSGTDKKLTAVALTAIAVCSSNEADLKAKEAKFTAAVEAMEKLLLRLHKDSAELKARKQAERKVRAAKPLDDEESDDELGEEYYILLHKEGGVFGKVTWYGEDKGDYDRCFASKGEAQKYLDTWCPGTQKGYFTVERGA